MEYGLCLAVGQEVTWQITQTNKQTNSVALSPQANYTD
jgi:ribosomal protein S1